MPECKQMAAAPKGRGHPQHPMPVILCTFQSEPQGAGGGFGGPGVPNTNTNPGPPDIPPPSRRTQLLPTALLPLPSTGAEAPQHQDHSRWDHPSTLTPPSSTLGC